MQVPNPRLAEVPSRARFQAGQGSMCFIAALPFRIADRLLIAPVCSSRPLDRHLVTAAVVIHFSAFVIDAK